MGSRSRPDYEPWVPERARALIERRAAQPGALLPILHDLQQTFGYVDPDAVPIAADILNLSQAEVYGVVTFYKDFRSAPPGRHLVRVCRAESCRACGGEELVRQVRERLRLEPGATSASGDWTLENVYCLGNCALSPAAQVDGALVGRAGDAWVDELASIATDAHDPPRARPAPVAGRVATSEVTVYVPRDSGARSVGADEVAEAVARGAEAMGRPVHLVRNGSRGMYWLEPLVEVVTHEGRVAYGPVRPADVAGLLDAGLLDGRQHALALGPTEEIEFLARQTRVTFARVGRTDPVSFADYVAGGGLSGLRRAVELAPSDIVREVTDSGLRGRGGAGFPTGRKWQTVLDSPADSKFVCCNADEGDSGTFADRMLLEGDPFLLIEGMVIAGLAVGAQTGYCYLRSEYPDAADVLRAAITVSESEGLLGPSVLGSRHAFSLHLRIGAGAYICGEETSMLESLEGLRGVVRAKPPLPAVRGLFGKPTIVNNVLTLAAVPTILADGADAYRSLGTPGSAGTQVFQLAGNVRRGGAVETAFGCTLRELVEGFGGGTRSGRPVRAVQVGGPLGAYLPASSLDVAMDYEALAGAGGMLGHGGIVVFDDKVDLAAQARFAMEFCAEESCGKCTPCRIGSVRGVEVIDRILGGLDRAANIELLEDLCETMVDGSLCAMGGLTPMPVLSALQHFAEDFEPRVVEGAGT